MHRKRFKYTGVHSAVRQTSAVGGSLSLACLMCALSSYKVLNQAVKGKFPAEGHCDSWHSGFVDFTFFCYVCCFCSVAKLCPTLVIPCPAARQASLSLPISRSLPKFMPTESVMPSSLILCHPLLLLPSISVFSNESSLRIRWPEIFSFSISPSNEYSGLISFRIDWFDLLAVQGTLKSLLSTTV